MTKINQVMKMMRGKLFLWASLSSILLMACQQEPSLEELKAEIDTIIQSHTSDTRVDRLVYELKIGDDKKLIISGYSTIKEAKTEVIDWLNNRFGEAVVDSLLLLPDPDLGEEHYALVSNSVANLRSQARHSAEMATQATMGMPLEVLKKEGSWYLVRTPDRYLAWVDDGTIFRMDKKKLDEWRKKEKWVFHQTYGQALQEPKAGASPVVDLVLGAVVEARDFNQQWKELRLPDGRKAFVQKDQLIPFQMLPSFDQAKPEGLVERARTLMGIPYLWGGTSSKGLDCSGFTKNIFFMNGLVIPRDASQQVHEGLEVATAESGFDQLAVGDLLFFGKPAEGDRPERVTHVAMWIGNEEFIHAASRVKINSVNPEADHYDGFNTQRFLRAKRYLNQESAGFKPVNEVYLAQ